MNSASDGLTLQPQSGQSRNRSYEAWILVSMFIVGAVLRAAKLNESFWLDELFTVQLSGTPLDDFIPELIRNHYRHLPLYYIFMRPILLFDVPEWVIRMPSLLFSVAKFPLFWLFARRVVRKETAYVALFLLVISPMDVWLAREARMYSMLQFFCLLGLYGIYTALQDGRRWQWFLFFVGTAFSIQLGYFGFLSVLAQSLFFMSVLISEAITHKSNLRPLLRSRAAPFCLCMAASLALFAPWTFLMYTWLRLELTTPGVVRANVSLGWDFVKLLMVKFGWGIGCGLWVSSLVLVIGAASSAVRERRLLWVGVLHFVSGVLPVFLMMKRSSAPVFMAKYIVFLLPLFILMVAEGFTFLTSILVRPIFGVFGLRGRPGFVIPVVAYGIAVIAFLPSLLGMFQDTRENWRGTCEFVARHKEPGDIIVVSPPYIERVLPYYGKGLPPLVTLAATDTAKLDEVCEQYSRVWYFSWRKPPALSNEMAKLGFVCIYDWYTQRFTLEIRDRAWDDSTRSAAALMWRQLAYNEIRYHPLMDSLLAQAYRGVGDEQRARFYFEQACTGLRRYTWTDPWIREDGSERVAYQYALAGVLDGMGQPDEARNAYLDILRLNPGNAGAVVHLADLAKRAQDRPEAIRRYEQFFEMAPDVINVYAAECLAALYQQEGDFERAFNTLKHLSVRLKETQSAPPKHWTDGAALLAANGQADRADTEFREIIDESPDYVYAYKRYAETLAQAGRQQEANELVRECLTRNPGNGEAQGLQAAYSKCAPTKVSP